VAVLSRRVGPVLQVLTDSRWFLPVVTALAIALALPSAKAGLWADDYVLLAILSGSDTLSVAYPSRLDIFNFFDGHPERARGLLDLGLLPWWMSPEVRVAFWRPVSALTHWLDFRLWQDVPALMHLQNVLWFGTLVVTTGLMYRRLMGRASAAAGVAALFYALDSAHAAGAVAWISGRNTIIGAVFGTVALMLHDRWRRNGSRSAGFISPVCLGMALLSAEGAVGIVAYLAAHAVFLDIGGWWRRLLALLPHATVVAAWRILYTELGYGVLGVGPSYVNPVREPLEFATALIKNGPILLLAQWTGPQSETFPTLSSGGTAVRWVGAVLLLTVVGAILAPLLRRDPQGRFWGAGMILAVVPIGAAMPHDRHLFFVGLGAMGLLAQFVCGLLDGAPWRSERLLWRWPARLLVCMLVVLHLVVAPIRFAQSAARPGDGTFERASDSIPTDPAVLRQLVVIVNVPHQIIVAYSFFIRTYKGQPIPAHTQVLSAGDSPISVYRADAQTLRVRWLQHQEQMRFRDKPNPMAPRERVRLTVEVTAVREDGSPSEATFRFDQNLDDAELRWLRWDSGGFVGYHPPAIGETMVVR
jgi:hypothetical protein